MGPPLPEATSSVSLGTSHRPEGSGEDGVLPGKQGVFGGRSPPLMHEQSAHDLCGYETPGGLWWGRTLVGALRPFHKH